MDYIRVTKENIDKEHICCAMSGKQSLAKKEWLKQRFEEGLVFYRSEERGMIRGHQFNKVEMVQYAHPARSAEAFEELVKKASSLVEKLGLHYRVSKLAAGDCSASMARTYDIEIQIPSMNGYKEVSSVSNARDYQARRGNIRFRREATGKPEFVHTLNGSGLATSRIFPAMVEQNQRADGSVVVPEVLRKYLGGIEVIEKK